MKFASKHIELFKKHESQFVSLKYPSLRGQLKQIDLFIHNANNDRCRIYDNHISLAPLANKVFLDPFRSLRTTSILCDNIQSEGSVRTYIKELMDNENHDCHLKQCSLTLEIAFCLQCNDKDRANNEDRSCLYESDPKDIYANLRSDIVSILESINIKTTYHYHGKQESQCVIGITGGSIIDLADNYLIAKYIIQNVAVNYGQEIAIDAKDNNYFTLIIQDSKDVLNQIDYNIKSNLCDLQKYISHFSVDDLNLSQHNNMNDMELGFCKMGFATELDFNPYIVLGMIMLCCSNKLLSFDKVLVNNDINTYLNDKYR